MLIKETIHQEDITLLNIYGENTILPILCTPLGINTQIKSKMRIVGDLYTPFSPTDRSSQPKVNKETSELNDIMDEMELMYLWNISSAH